MDMRSELFGTTAAPLFIQPHFDDVPLSCGGAAALASRSGPAPAIATIFAGEVFDEHVGELAAVKHRRWGVTDADEVVTRRRDEDEAACRELGCTTRWLGIPDAIYRDRYPTDSQLYGAIHAEEDALVVHLADEIEHLPELKAGASIFVPLAVGNHVDHQIAFEVGRRLAARGRKVWAYEDSPYCIHTPDGLGQRLKAVAACVGPEVRLDITETLQARLDAIARYATQVPVLFRFTNDWRGAVETHARHVGGGTAAERFWPVFG